VNTDAIRRDQMRRFAIRVLEIAVNAEGRT
jgi:hypothetical protein